MSSKNQYWWLADRVETEQERKVTLKKGLLRFLFDPMRDNAGLFLSTNGTQDNKFPRTVVPQENNITGSQ